MDTASTDGSTKATWAATTSVMLIMKLTLTIVSTLTLSTTITIIFMATTDTHGSTREMSLSHMTISKHLTTTLPTTQTSMITMAHTTSHHTTQSGIENTLGSCD